MSLWLFLKLKVHWQGLYHGIAFALNIQAPSQVHKASTFSVNRQSSFDCRFEGPSKLAVGSQLLRMCFWKAATNINRIQGRERSVLQTIHRHQPSSPLFQLLQILRIVKLKG